MALKNVVVWTTKSLYWEIGGGEDCLWEVSWLIMVHVHAHWWLWYGLLGCDGYNIVWCFKIEFDVGSVMLELFGCNIMSPIYKCGFCMVHYEYN